MAVKVQLLINGVTFTAPNADSIGYSGADHAFGASESFYTQTPIGANLKAQIDSLCAARSWLLPFPCEIIAGRAYDLVTGKVKLYPTLYQGTRQYTLNNANDAILCQSNVNSVAFQRHFWMHFSPDEKIKNGELVPDQGYITKVQNFFAVLAANWGWFAQTKVNVTRIISISATGLVQFAANNPFGAGVFVKIQKTFDPILKKFYSGRFIINPVGGQPTQGQLTGWPPVNTVRGQAFTTTTAFTSLAGPDGPSVVRSGTKKVGRPFELYRGRAVRRR